jgi:hypothetical protein
MYEPGRFPHRPALAPAPSLKPMAAAQAGINQPLGLTVYCWRIRLDQFA